ncbi:hypothetical protein SAMN04488008_11454 [Maribacter orientalis]|uniref:Uncharacterized protein n=1 Tax=Maribacter orientalis TaxID=228957 RepID=A0A1H7XAF3_9FLAO|nr:hypothetical protein [Maribacter orientalis]SEM30604.1 hypothetical protein SAMN04488008_11454 [Maribacter orientalis]
MNSKLTSLVKYYEKKGYSWDSSKEYMSNLYKQYVKRKEKSLIDAVAATAVIGGVVYSDNIDLDVIDTQMREAFELAFPGKSIDSLSDFNTEQLGGIVSAWKGKYFEVLVRDKLNAGEWVGDIHLEPGQVASLAESPTQEGWDLVISNLDGTIAQELQLKATESLGYVKEAIEKYPDIDVMTTDEVSTGIDGIFSSGINESDIEASIMAPLEDLLDSPLEEIAETILPGLPFLIIATREGRNIFVGKQSFAQGIEKTLEDSAKTGASLGVGALFSYFNPVLGIAATFATRYGMSQAEKSKQVISLFHRENENIRPLLKEYNV